MADTQTLVQEQAPATATQSSMEDIANRTHISRIEEKNRLITLAFEHDPVTGVTLTGASIYLKTPENTDIYSKKRGREIATGRKDKHPMVLTSEDISLPKWGEVSGRDYWTAVEKGIRKAMYTRGVRAAPDATATATVA